MTSPTAGVLIIGNEILSGKVQDANSPYLAKELRALGTSLERIIVVPDEYDAIVPNVLALSKAYTWVFTSGGVGPTHDDITIAAIARALGRDVLRPPELMDIIRGFFPDGRTTEASFKMADTVAGTTLHHHDSIRFPVMQVENIFILPGIPEIFRRDFEAIREMFRGEAYHLRTFYLQMYESDLAETLNVWLEDFPDIACGSYPVIGNRDWHVRVTVESKDAGYLESAVTALRDRLDPAAIFAVE